MAHAVRVHVQHPGQQQRDGYGRHGKRNHGKISADSTDSDIDLHQSPRGLTIAKRAVTIVNGAAIRMEAGRTTQADDGPA